MRGLSILMFLLGFNQAWAWQPSEGWMGGYGWAPCVPYWSDDFAGDRVGATLLTSGAVQTGRIDYSGDRDAFRVQLPQADTIRVELWDSWQPRPTGGWTTLVGLDLLDENGNAVDWQYVRWTGRDWRAVRIFRSAPIGAGDYHLIAYHNYLPFLLPLWRGRFGPYGCSPLGSYILTATLTTTVSATIPESSWWMYQADNKHSGHTATEELPPPLTIFWDRELIEAPPRGGPGPTGPCHTRLSHPVIAQERVFVSGKDNECQGRLYALSLVDGPILWTFAENVVSGPLAANGSVYVFGRGVATKVYALDPSNGEQVWVKTLPEAETGLFAELAAGHGMVYVNTSRGNLYALDHTNGDVRWSANTTPGDDSDYSSPAVTKDKIVVGSNDGLYAFDPTSGQQLWHYGTSSGTGRSSPIVYLNSHGKNLVFVSSSDGDTHAVNLQDGVRQWVYQGTTGAEGPLSGALFDQKLLVHEPSQILALDLEDGSHEWTSAPSNLALVSSAPVTTMRHVFFFAAEELRALRLNDGQQVWSLSLSGNGDRYASSVEAMAMSQGMLFVPHKGHVYALSPKP